MLIIVILLLGAFLLADFRRLVRRMVNHVLDVRRMLRPRRKSSRSTGKAKAPAAQPAQPARPSATSLAALAAPAWGDGRRSEVSVGLIYEAKPAEGGENELLVLAQARLTGPDRVRRLIREVVLTTLGPDGVERAVLSANPEWQRPKRRDFHYQTTAFKAGEKDFQPGEWIPLLKVSLNKLEFARQGANALRAEVKWRDAESGRTLASGRGECALKVSTPGYKDMEEEFQQPDWAAARVVAALVYFEERPSEAALQQLENWVDARTAPAERQPSMRAFRKARARSIVAEVGAPPAAQRERSAEESARRLARGMAPTVRAEAFEFFLGFVAAGGRVAPRMLTFVQKLGDWMEVPPEQARTLRDKILPISMHVADPAPVGESVLSADEILLGLTAKMTPEQRKAHLNTEYRKWNARADHPEARIREQARAMIEKIAQLRKGVT